MLTQHQQMPPTAAAAWSRIAAVAKRLWRSALEFAIAALLSLQDIGHDVLLALYALRLRDASLACPRLMERRHHHTARRTNSNTSRSRTPTSRSGSSGSASDAAADSDGDDSDNATSHHNHRRHLTRVRSSSGALAFLEQFRRGPETQSEWNLFLWRVTFPMVPLVAFTLFAVIGKLSPSLYVLLVCPVWYVGNFALVVYPFDVVFRFPDVDVALERALAYGFVAAALAIASVEWLVATPTSRLSWIVGNTLFGVVALVGIPLFLATQNRIPRTERANHHRPSNRNSSRTTNGARQDALTTEDDNDDNERNDGDVDTDTDGSDMARALAAVACRQQDTTTTAAPVLHDTLSRSTSVATNLSIAVPSGDDSITLSNHQQQQHQQSLPSTSLASNSSAHVRPPRAFATLKRPPRANRTSHALVALTTASIVVVYAAMVASYVTLDAIYWFVPYALAPVLCVVLYATRQTQTHFSIDHVVLYGVLIVHIPLFLGHLCLRLFALATAVGVNSQWLKLGVSILYLLLMQSYFFVITHVVNAMAEPFAHPSLLYISQLYYYLFWYILVGSDQPIDALYWSMLLLNNVHIALLNTGIYTDVKRSSFTCGVGAGGSNGGAWPLLCTSVGSSIAVCFRATTARWKSVETTAKRSSRRHVVRAAATMTTDEDDQEEEHESDAFVSDPETGSRATRRSVATTTTQQRPRNSSSNRCDLRRIDSSRQQRHLPAASSNSNSDHLQPLYFLMKLAEQDNMADTTALILVPSLLTLLAVFETPSAGVWILYEQRNLWLRCICMFLGRLAGAFLAREIFAYKLKTRLSLRNAGSLGSSNATTTIDGLSTRLWVQRLMLQDFHRQFWYLTIVTLVVTFACFDRVDVPLRFALLT